MRQHIVYLPPVGGLLQLPTPWKACSGIDLLGVEWSTTGPVAAAGVRCTAWAVASQFPDGSLQIAQCNMSRCTSWEAVRMDEAQPTAAQHDATSTSMSPWLKWSLISAGSLALTGVVLWQSGVFDSGQDDRGFVFTGPVSASF